METVYGSREDVFSTSSGTVSERVQNMASSVYREFELMIDTYGDGVISNLMPQIVAILENLNQAYREKQEHEVELELLRVENDNLKVQFEREKQLRKTNEQRYIQTEDAVDEERKAWSHKVQSLEIDVRKLEIKLRNMQEHVSRQDDRESELRDENSRLHNKYSELFKTHIDYVEHTKLSLAEQRQRAAALTSGTTSANSYVSKSENESRHNMSAASSLEETVLSDTTDSSHILKAEDDDVLHVDIVTGMKDVNTTSYDVMSHSVPEQRLVDDDVCIQDESATPDTQTFQEDPCQPVVCQSALYPSAVSQTDGVVCDTHTDVQLVHEDDSDVPSIEATFDDSEYHDCINASLAGVTSTLHSAELDDISVDLADSDGRMADDGHGSDQLNVSIYEELAGHSAAVLGEIDSGAELNVAGVGSAVDGLIAENNELLATKHALNIVKDDLIAKVDELNGEIDLLKEENRQLQRTIDEKSAKVAAVEEELKNVKDSRVDNETHFTRVDMMRVLMERNQYKERLIELQDAVRRADMARAAATEQMASRPTKKRSSLWTFFRSDSGSESSSSWSQTDNASSSMAL